MSARELPGTCTAFTAMDANSGVSPAFYLRRAELAEREGKCVAGHIWLERPAPPSKE